MSPDKQKYPLELKVKTVENYLVSRQSVRKIASDTGIPYQTIWDWIRLYREGSKDALRKKKLYKRGISKELETTVMFLKEQNPSMSISKAQQTLKDKKITISQRQIWHIWKKYGISRKPADNPYYPLCIATVESKEAIKQAQIFVEQGNFKEAGRILNSLPCMHDDAIVKQIPERYLSPRRRLDRLFLEYGEIPISEFGRKMHNIGTLLEKQGFIYSSITANFGELNALEWMNRPDERVVVLNNLGKKVQRVKNSALRFLYYIEQATIYCDFQQIDKALDCIEKCRRLVYRLPYANYWERFAALFSFLGKYKEAHYFYKKALRYAKDEETVRRFNMRIAIMGHCMAGEYVDSRKLLVGEEEIKHGISFDVPYYYLCRALIAFGKGNLTDASYFFLESLRKTTKGEFFALLSSVSIGLASVAMALNKRNDAQMYLRKYLPLVKRRKIIQEIATVKQLLGSEESVSEELLYTPYLNLLVLLSRANQTMKIRDYRQAYTYAERQRLMGLFHRSIVFFPAPVLHLLEKGRQTGLPRAILRFPVFNQNMTVCHVKFLGDVIILKQNKYSKIKLTPKEKALLIHLALRAGAPGKSLPAHDLRDNFWVHSTNPFQRLLHLLSSLKRKLAIPTHMLGIASSRGEPFLYDRNIYFTTDYGEFETLQIEIRTLERADQWSFARRDYLRAFKLLRGEPFRKMYDPWSEQMRAVILNKVNETLLNFVQSCSKHNNKKDAQRVVTRIATILPISKEVQNLMKDMAH